MSTVSLCDAVEDICHAGKIKWMVIGGSVGGTDALKAGHGFESHLSSLFSMKIEKTALRFVTLLTFNV